MNRPLIAKQTIVKLLNIVTIVSATIVIVENTLSLSPNTFQRFLIKCHIAQSCDHKSNSTSIMKLNAGVLM